MNEFDRRWRDCVARALAGSAAEPAEPPCGFATRVLARRRPSVALLPGLRVWSRFGWRALSGVALVLVVLAVWEYRDDHRAGLDYPRVHHQVVRAFWML